MLALVWGVTAIRGEQAGSMEERFEGAVRAALEAGHLDEGDQIILTGGTAGSVPGSTNVVEVLTVGEEG
jgi:pyruvate kinase